MPTPRVVAKIDGFNPHLPLPGGDALNHFKSSKDNHVSIHTSRCREVMLSGRV